METTRIVRCALVFLMTIGLSGAGYAQPLGGGSDVTASSSLIVEKVHGFHCREVLGWDPRGGVYRKHSHPGICKDYKRCLEVHHRCILVNGRGFEGWRYERWGYDNWRYTSCMLERGCY
jgi:hypothetical protein